MITIVNGNSSYEYYCVNKAKYFQLYNLMLENKELKLEKFIKVIENKFDSDFNTLDKLVVYLEKTKTLFSVSKSNIMFKIIEYVKDNNRTRDKEILDELIKKASIKNYIVQPSKATMEHQKNMKKIISDINTIISSDKSYKELVEDGIVTDEYLYSKTNKFANEIDEDMYIDFIIKYRGIEKLSIKELEQYKEVLEYFIEHLQKKSIRLTISNDDNTIRSMRVLGDSNVKTNVYSNTEKLKKWKLKRLNAIIEYYFKLLTMIEELINTKDIECLKKVEYNKEILKLEDDFIVSYHNNLLNIVNQLKNIKKMNSVTDSKNKSLCKKYNEKIIKESN